MIHLHRTDISTSITLELRIPVDRNKRHNSMQLKQPIAITLRREIANNHHKSPHNALNYI